MDVVLPEQVVGDDPSFGVDDRDSPTEGEPLVALQVSNGCESARELGDLVSVVERTRYDYGSGRDVCPGPACRPETQAHQGQTL